MTQPTPKPLTKDEMKELCRRLAAAVRDIDLPPSVACVILLQDSLSNNLDMVSNAQDLKVVETVVENALAAMQDHPKPGERMDVGGN